jgi:hypothetical protein
VLVELIGCAALCPIALRRPRVLPKSTAIAQSSNGHCAPTVKRNRPDVPPNRPDAPIAQCLRTRSTDRTCSTQRSDATVPSSGSGPESSHRDRTRPIACDWTCRAFDQLFAMLYSSGCPTGRSGFTRDRTHRLQTLTPTRQTATPDASGAASDHPGDLCSPPFLSMMT